jgi:hypothetical protein
MAMPWVGLVLYTLQLPAILTAAAAGGRLLALTKVSGAHSVACTELRGRHVRLTGSAQPRRGDDVASQEAAVCRPQLVCRVRALAGTRAGATAEWVRAG